MLMQPYIFFKNNCAEAMRFYEKTLDGKLEMMPFKNMPDFATQFPPEMAEL
ncbi:MAG: VOC family protein, partial [Comamonadaceae bacterium]